MAMTLPSDELRRRIKAAAEARGLGMRKLREALDDYGVDKTLAEAMIRGEHPQHGANIRAIAETLGMAEQWFTAETWEELVEGAPAADSELAIQARERAARVLSPAAAPVEDATAEAALEADAEVSPREQADEARSRPG